MVGSCLLRDTSSLFCSKYVIDFPLCNACSFGLRYKIDKAFTQEAVKELNLIFVSVCRDFEDSLAEFDGERDHVHLIVNYPPKISISKLINSLKGVSSRLLRNKGYKSIEQALWGKSLWLPSYFAGSCGGAPIEIIRQYIENEPVPYIASGAQFISDLKDRVFLCPDG